MEEDNKRLSKELDSTGNKAQEFESLSTSLQEKLDQTKAECDLAQSNLQQSTQSQESLASDFSRRITPVSDRRAENSAVSYVVTVSHWMTPTMSSSVSRNTTIQYLLSVSIMKPYAFSPQPVSSNGNVDDGLFSIIPASELLRVFRIDERFSLTLQCSCAS